MAKKPSKKPKEKVIVSEENCFLVQIQDMTEEEYEQLVSVLREKCPRAEIFCLQRECLYGG